MKKNKLLAILGLTLCFQFSCEDPWDKHLNEFSLDSATQNLLELIQDSPELSTFYGFIVNTEAEDIFAQSIIQTVWAPSNDALNNLSAEISEDSDKLRQFIENHIASGKYPQSSTQEEIRCKMLNGKRIPMNMAEASIYGTIVSGEYNVAATNGILHIIDQSIEMKENIWEYIEDAETGNDQIDFLNSLSGEVFVDTLATIVDYDPVTSAPIYDTTSGTIWYNQFLFDNADLRNEDSLFTMLILENDAYNEMYTRFRPYFNLPLSDGRDTVRFWNYMISIDLVASGKILAEDLSGSLISVNGIEVPITSGQITESIETSNGIIHKLSSFDLSLEAKFPPIIIEGELESKIIYTGGGKEGYTRNKPLASGGLDFVLDDHDASPGRIVYQAGMVAATKYEFYWLAVDDFEGTYYGTAPDSLIQQKLEKVIYVEENPIETRFPMHKPISDSLLYVEDLSYETAQERYAGSLTFTYYEDFWFHLIGSGNNTALTIDYIKIVPVFE